MSYFGVKTNWSTEYNGETVEYDVLFTCDYTPPVEGNLFGLPEDCYPSEPAEYEFSDIEIEIADGVWTDMRAEHEHLLVKIMTEVVDSIIEIEKGNEP